MLVRTMVDHEVHNKLHAPLMQPLEQLLPILHGAKLMHDPLIIANIVPVIIVRRFVYRAQPNDIYSQCFQVIQLGDDPL
ncbi:hypothetical protein D3C76_1734320 [compost metagenome]